MTTSMTRPCFTTKYQTCKTKAKTKTDFLVSDRSCPKTGGLRPHYCILGHVPSHLISVPVHMLYKERVKSKNYISMYIIIFHDLIVLIYTN